MEKRPGIVVVMGHVDHGKTTLLDYIRKTNIASREAGGITQSVGAYEITHKENRLTFIDTPGHEAFSKMRERGARIADLAILVVAADDGVKPQTKDALAHIKNANLPFVIAINKIDKANADIEKTKNDLMQNGIYLEGAGGDISYQEISAKTGQGIPDLLDLIILAADMLNLTYEKEVSGTGVILTAYKDPKRGNMVSAIVKNGALKARDDIQTKSASGKIKILENFLGKTVSELTPSSPALILGFEHLPEIGEEFTSGNLHKKSDTNTQETKPTLELKKNDGSIRIILKAKEAGSLEAVRDYIESLRTGELPYRVIDSSIGNVHESDAKLAENTKAIILNFDSEIDRAADTIIKVRNIPVLTSNIIYELDEQLKTFIEKKLKKVTGIFEILALFGEVKNQKQIAGGRLNGSKVKNNDTFRIIAGDREIGTGKVVSIRQNKETLREAQPDAEYGFFVETNTKLEIGQKFVFD